MSQWTPQQEAIFAQLEGDDPGHIVVRARAGTGKTTSIIEGVTRSREARAGQEVMLCAFNKEIAEELKRRISGAAASIDVCTSHAAGMRIVRRYWPGTAVDGKRCWKLAEAHLGQAAPDAMVGLVAKLALKGKELHAGIIALDDLEEHAFEFDLEPSQDWLRDGWTTERVCKAALSVVEASTTRDGTIDFADMIRLPLVHNWVHPRYALIVVDECFVGDTPILLADGRQLPISEIVNQRLDVSVLSFDTGTGCQVAKRVTAFHRVPLRKRLVRVSVQQYTYKADGRRNTFARSQQLVGKRILVCTEDHRFWTKNRGWIAAQDLVAGDVVQVETSAARDISFNHRHKHTLNGKETLKASVLSRRPGKRAVRGNSNGPRERGGNGCGLTDAQRVLLDALPHGWRPEVAVPTKKPRRSGWPTAYKLDLAHEGCRVGIEVDGGSHSSKTRQQQDRKKEVLLAEMGWRVIRVTNREAIRETDRIVASLPPACPVDAEVTSVDETDQRENFVYDIAVEDTHCYYAHGVLVHNCQDFAVPNLELCERLLAPGGRMLVVGDDRQAIYGWRGADSTALDRLKKKLAAHELGLTVTWRCPRLVVDYAREMVPDFRAAEHAPEGEAGYCSEAVLPGVAKPGDVILSRTNAPLATMCLALLRLGVPARIRGGGELDLPGLVRTLSRGKGVNGLGDFIARLHKWEMREVAKAVQAMERAKHMEAAQRKLQLVRDKAATLEALCEGLTTIHELEARIADIFTVRDARECVLLSTVHKAKGLEWDRVFLLYETFQGQRGGEEENIEYVAVTRAKSSLVFVGSLPAHFAWLMKVKMRTDLRLSGRPALELARVTAERDELRTKHGCLEDGAR